MRSGASDVTASPCGGGRCDLAETELHCRVGWRPLCLHTNISTLGLGLAGTSINTSWFVRIIYNRFIFRFSPVLTACARVGWRAATRGRRRPGGGCLTDRRRPATGPRCRPGAPGWHTAPPAASPSPPPSTSGRSCTSRHRPWPPPCHTGSKARLNKDIAPT